MHTSGSEAHDEIHKNEKFSNMTGNSHFLKKKKKKMIYRLI